jgi:GEVED domain
VYLLYLPLLNSFIKIKLQKIMKKCVLTASLWMLLVSIKLMAQAPQYCASKSTFPWEQWIERVSISNGNFSNPSGKDGYGNFTNFMGATLKRNAGNLVTISPKSSWNGDPRNANMYWRVWVDLNGDKDFEDAGEMLINRKVTISNGVFLDNESSFFVPLSAKLGLTRLRVAMKVGGEPTPCEVFERGEVEDYTVNIIDEPTTNRDTLRLVNIVGATSVRQGGQITLNVTIKNTGVAASNPNTPLSIYQNQQPFIFKGPPPTYLTIVSNRTTIGRAIQPNETVTVPVTFTVFSNFSHITRPEYTGVEYKGTYVVIGNRSNDVSFNPYFNPVLDTLTVPYNITALLDNTDLKINIIASDTTYKRDGKHSFIVKVTNNGTVVAKDVIANLGTVTGSFNTSIFTATRNDNLCHSFWFGNLHSLEHQHLST